MAPKTAPWGRWPAEWLKKLPAPFEQAPTATFSTVDPGSSGSVPKRNPRPEAVVHRFEDFAERRGTLKTDGGPR